MTSTANTPAEELAREAEHLLAARRLPEALDLFARAEAAGCDPDRCAAGRWLAAMLTGNFEAAWQESDVIRRRGRPDPHRFWNGEPLAGKRVILRCLHGFGDAVQFLRYLPLLRAIARRVWVEVPPRFVALAGAFCGMDEVITWGEGAPDGAPAWDVQIEVNELPYVFRTQLSDLPIAMKYLQVSPPLGRQGTSERLRVGVNTTVGEWNPRRGVPFRLLEPLFALDGVEFYDLRPSQDRADPVPENSGLWRDSSRCADSTSGLAETIAELDLVITPDTLAAHLAGALGVWCWVLLEQEADWRWMLNREDSPWYPTLRLFRQPQPGDWSAVIDSVRTELRVATEEQSAERSMVVQSA